MWKQNNSKELSTNRYLTSIPEATIEEDVLTHTVYISCET
jgi:hypothetical protein